MSLGDAGKLLISGSVWSFLLQAVSKLSVLFSTLIGASLLGVVDFGIYVSMHGVMLLAVSLWDLGYTPMMTRDVSAGDVTVPQMLQSAVHARAKLLIIPLMVLVLGALVLGVNTSTAVIAMGIFGVAAVANSASVVITGALNASLRFRDSMIANSMGRIGFVLSVVAVATVEPGTPLVWLTVAFLIGELVNITALAVCLKRVLNNTWIPRGGAFGGSASLWAVVRRSSPYALSGLLILVYNRLDVVIVSVVAGAEDAGLYAPASRILDAMLIFPMTAVAALIPVAARQFRLENGPDAIKKLLLFSVAVSMALSVPATILVLLAARPIVDVGLGTEFSSSIVPIRILALSIPFVALGAPLMSTLTAIGRPRLATAMIAVGFVTSTMGIVLLAPRWGAEGAAWASMLREPMIAFSGLALMWKVGGFRTQKQ